MGTHLVVGSGSVGTALARQLGSAGHHVVLASRTGSGASIAGVHRVSANAADVNSLLTAATTADAVYNCVNPRYHEWARDWPPMAAAFNSYAERTQAVLVTCSNLYGYGPVDVPMTEDLALAATGTKARIRVRMWQDTKSLHDEGRIRAAEVRGSDYLVASDQSHIGSERVVPRVLAGKSVTLLGAVDLPHTWTSPTDVARLMAVVAEDERGWGRPWHVPSNPARTQQQVVDDFADAAGVKHVAVRSIPDTVVWALGLANPLMKELRETAYQFARPYLLDDSAARAAFGMEPTPWAELIEEVLTHYR